MRENGPEFPAAILQIRLLMNGRKVRLATDAALAKLGNQPVASVRRPVILRLNHVHEPTASAAVAPFGRRIPGTSASPRAYDQPRARVGEEPINAFECANPSAACKSLRR